MAWVFLVLWLATVAVLVRAVGIRGLGTQAAPLMRRLDQPSRDRAAIEAAKADRAIRELDHELAPNEKHKHVNCSLCGPGPLFRGQVPSKYSHPFFKDEKVRLSDGYGSSWWENRLQASLAEYADVVSSAVIEDSKMTGKHTIMLDFDFPVTVVESSTPGHHHFYTDVLVTWPQLRGLLKALRDCGLIEDGYYQESLRRRATNLRPPWVVKPVSGGVVPQPKPRRSIRRKGK